MILFRKECPDWGFLSNFSEHSITVDGVVYATVEHYFQAHKCVHQAEHEAVRLAATPGDARRLGKRVTLRPGWNVHRITVMVRALRLKFDQHPDIRQRLLDSGNEGLMEWAPWDPFWGSGKHGDGNNTLGRLLMDLRSELRK